MKPIQRRAQRAAAGFSLVEVVMTLAIGLIMVSVALPMVVNALQGYRLNSIVQQASSLMSLARASAIRRNAVVSLLTTSPNGTTILYIDLNGNGKLDPNEPRLMLPNDMTITNAPDPKSMNIGSTQKFTTGIAFDYRGAVYFNGGGPINTYFLAIGYTNQLQYGSRAVTVSPMGQAKVWIAPPSGTWTGM